MFKRIGPAINLGILFFAALLSDFLLGVFFWLGLETAFVPNDFPHLHFLRIPFYEMKPGETIQYRGKLLAVKR